MPKIQNRYKQSRATFLETAQGHVWLELAVGETQVLVITKSGIKATVGVTEVEGSKNQFIVACKEAEPDKFNSFIQSVTNAE